MAEISTGEEQRLKSQENVKRRIGQKQRQKNKKKGQKKGQKKRTIEIWKENKKLRKMQSIKRRDYVA